MLSTPMTTSDLLNKTGKETVLYDASQASISHRHSPRSQAWLWDCMYWILLPVNTMNKAESALALSSLHMSSEHLWQILNPWVSLMLFCCTLGLEIKLFYAAGCNALAGCNAIDMILFQNTWNQHIKINCCPRASGTLWSTEKTWTELWRRLYATDLDAWSQAKKTDPCCFLSWDKGIGNKFWQSYQAYWHLLHLIPVLLVCDQ